MAIQIREHAPGENLDLFIGVAHEVFRGDANWVPPLELELRDRLTPHRNPFFQHAQARLFTAHRDGRLVGRISAQIDHEHLRVHDDQTGFFGFFDSVDDAAVGKALLDAATEWVDKRGMRRVRGPLSLSINEEVGTLVEGFDSPPVLMMPYARPYQGALVEQCGFEKAKDLLAWRYDVHDIPKRAQRAWETLDAMPEFSFRSVNKKHMESELKIIMEIFNDAWKNNWGYVPATAAEVKKAAEDMKLILDEEIAFFAEMDGRPVAMCICLPNLNEAIADLQGKLMPFGIVKLLWRTKVRHLRSARLLLLGVREELQRNKKLGGMSLAMCVELARRGTAKGYEWAELGWTLEDNHLINLGIRAMGAKVTKRFRVYERALPVS